MKREPTGRWARVVWLDREIREGRCPSVGDMMELFGGSKRMAQYTLEFIRDSLHAPLAYDRKLKGYYYTDPTFALPAVILGEGEVLAILLAEQVTRHYLGTSLEAPLRAAVEKISRYLPDEVRVELGDLAGSFHVAGGTAAPLPLSLLADFERAIRERRVVRIAYYSPERDEVGERDVEPHFLLNVRGDWMVVTWDRRRETDRVFMLARVREWEVREERFTPRPELSPGTYTAPMFLTEHNWEEREVVLRFDSYRARWIRERTWHPSQTIEELEGGGLLLRLRVAGEGDLYRWVLSFGAHVEVLEPSALRERVAAEAEQVRALYEASAKPRPPGT